MNAPVPHKHDWDIARPNADFTSRRRDAHTEAYFNSVNKRELDHNDTAEAAGLKLSKRATSGRWENSEDPNTKGRTVS